ncbi:TolC family protein [Hydrotalea sp.]|uniref:TolC family protein n=1 Tax=Hydrotalea sp. TaxID=2881279 RepID=UPI0026259CE6|nr:TolC family protein [Hydrotalea sp.]
MKNKQLVFIICFLLAIGSLSAQKKNLAFFVDAAIQNSPLLKDYHNQQLSNIIDSLRIHALYKPQINAISVNTYAPSYQGWGYDGAITNGANVAQQFTANKLLIGKENMQNQQQAIQLLNQGLQVAGKITGQDITKAITAQYITAFGTQQQIQFNKELVDLLKKEEVILKKLTESGIYKQTDYLSFLVTIQQQDLLIHQLRIQFSNDYGTLNYLCGLTDTTYTLLEKPDIQLVLTPEIEQTVFYKQFFVDSLKLKNSDAQIDFSYRPKLSLYADAGYLSSFAYQAYKNFGTSFGVSVVWPIYDGKQRKMKHDKVAIAEQTRQQYRNYFKAQFQQQIAQLAQQLQSVQALIQETNTQIKYTQTLIEANRKLLQTGDVVMPNYILAIGNYLNAKNLITQNTINKLQIINQINYWNRN